MLTLRRAPSASLDFAKRHSLHLHHRINPEELATDAAFAAYEAISSAYAKLDSDALEDASVGFLLNMLHRNFEHVDGAFAALLTGCGSSAEVISRASIEASLNIVYILAGNREERLAAYFYYYLGNLDRQARQWAQEVERLKPDDGNLHRTAIAQRPSANDVVRGVVDGVFGEPSEQWPNTIAKRFAAIGESLTYRTFYARMSSEIHADAEETIRFYVSRTVDDSALLTAMMQETEETSRYYAYYATEFYLRAAFEYSRAYGLSVAEQEIADYRARVANKLLDIAGSVGAGL